MLLLQRACREAVPRRRAVSNRRPAYWWTDEIAGLRRECLQLRRQLKRPRTSDPDAAPLVTEFKVAKTRLKWAIKRSKQRCWDELTNDINVDPWGLGYKIVTRKLGAQTSSAPRDPLTVHNIVDTLFPDHPKRPQKHHAVDDLDIPPFSEVELSKAARSMRNRRAPGPDGLPAELIKAVALSHPSLLLSMYNSCLKAGVFPARWKVARLVLISKGKGPADAPSSYRPLCMLDTAGKLMEKMIRSRLQSAVEAAGGLSRRQCGFRRGLSTIDAISEVVAAATSAKKRNHFSRPVCLLATLDVKNAFNSVRWDKAMEALERDFRPPAYILNIMEDYLKDRSLIYDTADGPQRKTITSGAAQGSILGPDIWNIFYDGILRMEMPEGTFLEGYADDIALVISARDTEVVQMRLNQAMRRVGSWMESRGLELAEAKTEIVFLTTKRIEVLRPMTVGHATVQTKHVVKYLGVMLDNKLTFGAHIARAAEKAAAVTTALSRLMANTKGPSPGKRRLLLRAAEAIMLYGAEVWADALRHDYYRKRLAAVQRRCALRIACSYRTVSEPAAMVIAGVIPIDLLAAERRFVHEESATRGRLQVRHIARSNTITTWQERWISEPRGRWTARLIAKLDTWLDREWGEVNYYLTQFLSGHGQFRAYLHKMGKVADPGCVHCGAPSDSAYHTFFECERWSAGRRALEQALGSITPESIIPAMLSSEMNWKAVASYVEATLKKKKREEEEGQPAPPSRNSLE